jgi:hypothetical protein|tara:strand:- start:438 stop:761 length:324 start_codon:yes stop_codon:yes gene_type:complete
MSHTALINKGWPGLLRQELTTYEMYSGTVSKKTVTRVFDVTGRYYDSNNEFSFHQEGTTWASSLQNTMLLDPVSREHLVESDFTGVAIESKIYDGDGSTDDEFKEDE